MVSGVGAPQLPIVPPALCPAHAAEFERFVAAQAKCGAAVAYQFCTCRSVLLIRWSDGQYEARWPVTAAGAERYVLRLHAELEQLLDELRVSASATSLQ